MSRRFDPEFDAWKAEASEAPVLEVAAALGARLHRAGREQVGPCPVCGGDDRFQVNAGKNKFLCRTSGAKGDAISMVMHVHGCDFITACQFINNTDPPRGTAGEIDLEYARKRRDEQRDREIERRAEDSQRLQNAKTVSQKVWGQGVPIFGTHAERYLGARGLVLTEEQAENLKFIERLVYRGRESAEAESETKLGVFPCMIAAIRNFRGEIIGVHRTYLDPEKPQKLVPPGDARNKPKKILGAYKGGAIWFGPITDSVAIAEGIETALSWEALGYGEGRFTICAAAALNNLSGESTGTKPHPEKQGVWISNSVPDVDRPGIILPENVRNVMFLGDGDSEPISTKALLLTGVNRLRAEGRTVAVHMATEGMDWNDVHRRMMGATS